MVKISLTKLDPGPLNFSIAEWALFSFPMLKYHDGETSADGGGVVPRQPAAHSVHHQDPDGHHRHGQPGEPAPVPGLSDLRHKNLNVGRVAGGGEADQESARQHHPEILGRGAEDPAQEVGEGEHHQGHSPAKLFAKIGGDQTSKDGAKTEHGGYP